MQFEPLGGFPPIIRKDDNNITEKTLETRGFVATSKIASINEIMSAKKKKNPFLAFGSDDEDGFDTEIERLFDDKPHDYQKVVYKEMPIKKPTNSAKKNIRS